MTEPIFILALVPCLVPPLRVAWCRRDARHAKAAGRCLAGCTEGLTEEAELRAIVDAIEAYEAWRP
jgi:hypothetical protein